jgi:hypothetical protein
MGRIVAGVVILAASLGACSSGDDDGASTTTSTTTTSTSKATTTTSVAPFPGTTDDQAAEGHAETTVHLRLVSVTHEEGVDRVIFQFLGGATPDVQAYYVEQPTQDGSGDPVDVDGEAFLMVRFEPASVVDMRGETPTRTDGGRDRVTGEAADVVEVVRAGDYEAVLTWAVGLTKKDPFVIRVIPDQFMVAILIGTS